MFLTKGAAMIQFSDSGTCRTSHHSALWFEWVGGQGKIHKWHQLTEQIRFQSSANLGHLVCHLYSVSTGIYSCYVLLLVSEKLEKPVSGQQALQIISGLKMLGWQLKGRNGFDSSILHKPMVMLENRSRVKSLDKSFVSHSCPGVEPNATVEGWEDISPV